MTHAGARGRDEGAPDIALTLARYDERMLAMTTRLNLMDKRRDELRQEPPAA